MIQLDRSASAPVGEQLVEQLRFHLATGRYRPGEQLPSTRELGRQLEISFHTVRKAYQTLEQAGLLASRPGSGYTVVERATEPVADRMERGATVVQEALQRLIGLGLSESEVEYVIQEQLAYFDTGATQPKVVFAAAYRELAEACAEQVSAALQTRAEAVTLDAIAEHADADVIVVPHADLQRVTLASSHAEVVGVLVHPPSEALAEVARLLPSQTLGLVTRHGDAVGPLLQELRFLAGFSGPAIALQADADRERLADLLREVELIAYTPQARRKLRPLLAETPSVLLAPMVERRSLESIAAAIRPGV